MMAFTPALPKARPCKYRPAQLGPCIWFLAVSCVLILSGCSDDKNRQAGFSPGGKVLVVNNSILALSTSSGRTNELERFQDGLFLELNTLIDDLPEEEEDDNDNPLNEDNDIENKVSDFEIIVDETDHIAFVRDNALYTLDLRSGGRVRLAQFSSQVCAISALKALDQQGTLTNRKLIVDLPLIHVVTSPNNDCSLPEQAIFAVRFDLNTTTRAISNIDISIADQAMLNAQLIVFEGLSLVNTDPNTHGYLAYDEHSREVRYYNYDLVPLWETYADFVNAPPVINGESQESVIMQLDENIFVLETDLLKTLSGQATLKPSPVPSELPQEQIFAEPAISLDAINYMSTNFSITGNVTAFEYGDGIYALRDNQIERIHQRAPGQVYEQITALPAIELVIAKVTSGPDARIIAINPDSKVIQTLSNDPRAKFTSVREIIYINEGADSLAGSRAIRYDEEFIRREIDGAQWLILDQTNKEEKAIYLLQAPAQDEPELDGDAHLFEFVLNDFNGGFDLGPYPYTGTFPINPSSNRFIKNGLGIIGYEAGASMTDNDIANMALFDPLTTDSTINLVAPR